ncbi:MAG: DUF3048 domain-containing protein [Chloroflexi bacterium]|nr:DUF3048 domain-containing protein [Chloroflexota bacterium]
MNTFFRLLRTQPTRLLLMLALSFTSACSAAQGATATPFRPQVTIMAPTNAPAATATNASAATATNAPAATDVAAPTSTPTEAAGVSAGTNPYTGLPASAEVLARKPLLIKVANTAEIRPQSGLSEADIVVEHLSEGGITRFTSLFLTNAPKKVGSVRSCRLIDLELPVMFDAALVCSGTSPGVKPLMRNSYAHKNDLTMISDFGPYECASCPMFRTSDRSAPHNLFANPTNAWAELDKRERNQPSTFKSWSFAESAGPEGKPTAGVNVGYKSGVAGWNYDAVRGRWLRSISGKQQVDANNSQPLAFANVVLVYAPHVTTLIQEDVTGALSIEVQVWGEGPVRVFRDGREYGGKWVRNAEVGNFELLDPAGKHIPLKPGNTWIEMVPLTGVDVGTR